MTPFALSISGEIKSLGAYAGFAAVVGLALLALLYFAQAREIRRLTEWAGRAPERSAASGPSVAGATAGPVAPAGVPGVSGAAAGVSPGALANVRPVGPARPQLPGQPPAPFAPAQQTSPPGRPPGTPPAPVFPGAAASPLTQATTPGAGATQAFGSVPAAPAGFPPPARPQASGGPGYTPVPGAPASPPGYPPVPGGSSSSPAGYPPVPGGGTAYPPAPQAPSAASRFPAAPVPVGAGVGVGASRAQPLAGPASVSRPAAEVPPRRSSVPGTERTSGAPAAGRSSPARTRPSNRRTLGLVAGAFVILVILVFAATHFLGGGGKGAGSPRTSSVPSAGSQSPAVSAPAAVAPATVTVAVLNGTTVAGLAAKIAKRLTGAGYVKGYVGDAPTKSAGPTSVEYALNEQPAAKQVAKALGLSSTAVVPLDPATAAVSPSVSGAQVVVSVGSDLHQ